MLAANGVAVVVADRDTTGGESTVRGITAAGGRARFARCDVQRPDELAAAVRVAVDAFGELSCAVNSAGVLRSHGTLECTPEDWQLTPGGQPDRRVARYACRARTDAEPRTRRNRQHGFDLWNGRLGRQCRLQHASKHGVIGLTRSAALQYAAHSIRINAVCPGHTYTAMTEPLLSDPEWLRQRLGRYPIGRLAQPEETAHLVCWLCSDRASFVTGQALPVDGGYTAQMRFAVAWQRRRRHRRQIRGDSRP